MIQAVIFDMDGLMFDTEALAKTAWLQVGRELGYPIGEAQLAKIRGRTPAASAEVFRAAFGPAFDYPRAKARRNALVEAAIHRDGIPVKPGLPELLRQLRAEGIRTAVASGSPKQTIWEYLALAGLEKSYDVCVSAEMVPRSKPAPDVFLLASQQLGEAPGNCLVLEDSGNGLLAAAQAGIPSVCVPDLAPPEPDILALAEAVFPDLTRVYGWIEARNKGGKWDNPGKP